MRKVLCISMRIYENPGEYLLISLGNMANICFSCVASKIKINILMIFEINTKSSARIKFVYFGENWVCLSLLGNSSYNAYYVGYFFPISYNASELNGFVCDAFTRMDKYEWYGLIISFPIHRQPRQNTRRRRYYTLSIIIITTGTGNNSGNHCHPITNKKIQLRQNMIHHTLTWHGNWMLFSTSSKMVYSILSCNSD